MRLPILSREIGSGTRRSRVLAWVDRMIPPVVPAFTVISMDARRCFSAVGLVVVVALVGALLAPNAPAQVQRNAGFEPTVFAITKAKLVISPEEEIDQGILVIRDGLIVAAGKEIVVPADAEVIDGTGLVVYPGFIDAGTSVLLDPNRGTTPVAGRPIDFARFALASTPPDNRKSLTPEFEAPQGLKTDLAGIEARRKA